MAGVFAVGADSTADEAKDVDQMLSLPNATERLVDVDSPAKREPKKRA